MFDYIKFCSADDSTLTFLKNFYCAIEPFEMSGAMTKVTKNRGASSHKDRLGWGSRILCADVHRSRFERIMMSYKDFLAIYFPSMDHQHSQIE